jgi:hypothetical protein
MTADRRTAMKRLGLRRQADQWIFHGKPQLADDQVDAVDDAAWQALVARWRRNQMR